MTAPADTPEPTRESTTTESPLRILHLEDNPSDRELVRETLGADGFQFEITYAGTRLEFEDALERPSLDLILSDYSLPTFDGLSALRLANEKRPETPLILLSGTVGEEKAVEIMKSGATDYVLKENLERLGPVVRRALREAKGRAERRRTEERYRTLFESMDEGYCVVEMLYDPAGKAIDYRFVEINPAFEKHTGLQDALGKTILEMVPHHDAHWFEIYGRVARTGEPIRFENPAEAMQRYYDAYAFRIGGPGSRRVGILFSDITARKQAEETLRENRVRLELAIHASRIGPWEWNLLTNEVYFSPEWKRQIGYADDELLNQGSEWETRLHPEDHDSVLAAVNAYRNDPSLHYDIEFRLRHKDGSYRWIHSSAELICNGNGKAARIVGCHVDITESKRAIDRLREQASLLDKAQDAILVRDIENRITYWNVGAERIYGWRADEAVGRSVEELLRIDPQTFQQASVSVLQNGEWIGELQKVAKDGRTLTVEARWTLMRDNAGQPKSILDISTDATERKSLEEQLQQSQKMEAVGRCTRKSHR